MDGPNRHTVRQTDKQGRQKDQTVRQTDQTDIDADRQ